MITNNFIIIIFFFFFILPFFFSVKNISTIRRKHGLQSSSPRLDGGINPLAVFPETFAST